MTISSWHPSLFVLFLCFFSGVSSSQAIRNATLELSPLSDQSPSVPDIIAVLPDRSTAYPNGVHNGLLLTARNLGIFLEVRDVGNFDPKIAAKVLNDLIAMPSQEQPQVYLIWPIDYPTRVLLQQLWEKHRVPIIQMNQLPDEWEWDHLIGYAGPDDRLRASNAGKMMQTAMTQRNIQNPAIVALGYPDTYGGYHLSIQAFEKSINGSDLLDFNLLEKLPLDWGTHPAYQSTLRLIDTYGNELNGIYAMDDNILLGAYQAILDHPLRTNITLVGTVCNGARELLETNAQYGTTVQGPFLEGDLAVRAAAEYIQTGTLQLPLIRFTPNPIVTAATWDNMFVDFMGESYTADSLCTWTVPYERVAGVEEEDVDQVNDICAIVKCDYIPRTLLYTGLVMCGINYGLALVSFVGLYFYQKMAIIQLAQPFFLFLVILGCLVDNTSIILMSRDNYNRESSPEEMDGVCFAIPWVLALGHMMTTATLVAKIYRVKKILGACNSQGGFHKARKVSITSVFIFILAFMGVDMIILIAWSIVDPMQWQILISSYDQNGYVVEARGECGWNSHGWIFALAISLFHFATLLYANALAYQTRDFHKISDSKNVAIALFNSIQLLVIVSPLLVVVDDVATSYFIKACFVFLNNFGVLVLVVVPKLWQCFQGHGNQTPDLHSMTMRASGKERASRISGWDGTERKHSSNDYDPSGYTNGQRRQQQESHSVAEGGGNAHRNGRFGGESAVSFAEPPVQSLQGEDDNYHGNVHDYSLDEAAPLPPTQTMDDGHDGCLVREPAVSFAKPPVQSSQGKDDNFLGHVSDYSLDEAAPLPHAQRMDDES